MLLDRRRINKWAKWVALFLAIVFGGGFLFMGVGYGGAGFNLSELFTRNKTTVANPETPEAKIALYQAKLQEDPKDVAAMLGLATVYQQNDDLRTAAGYLEMVIATDPAQKEVYLRLANLYLNPKLGDAEAAVAVLNKATQVDEDNPDVYLKLGTAQNTLGHTRAALLAWEKFLQLAPNHSMADVVGAKVEELSKEVNTTTTVASSTTTTVSSDTTAAAGTTTTVRP